MFKKLIAAGLATAALTGGNAIAANTANMTFTGVINASPCTFVLGNNGNVDYGTLSSIEVQAYPQKNGIAYEAKEKFVAFGIDCNASKNIWISISDNRSDSVFSIGPADDIHGFGLGKSSNNEPIGQYHVSFANLLVTANPSMQYMKPLGYFVRPNGNSSTGWNVATGSMKAKFQPTQDLAFELLGLSTPSPTYRVSGMLSINSYFNKSLVDNALERIVINGSSTFTIHYP